MKGFPLGSSRPWGGSEVAIEVKKGPIDAAILVVPGGYTKVDSPM
jgi:hypothetical protein